MRIYKETTKLFITRATMVLIAIQHPSHPCESISSVDFLIECVYEDDVETLRLGCDQCHMQVTARGNYLEVLPKQTCSIAF